jgi:PLD-like domain
MQEMTEGRLTLNAEANSGGVRIVIPLEVTVRIAEPALSASDDSAGTASGPTSRRPALIAGAASPIEAAAAVKQHLQSNPNVVGVRATYLFKNGELSDEKGVVIKVRPEASRDPRDYGLESSIGGVPVSIEMADLESLAGALAPEAVEAPAAMQAYKRDLSDPKFNLDPITDNTTLTLHVSPEAGWRELSKFFEGDDYDRITIGMYNFTAPHIIEAVRAAVEPHIRQMTLTLDRKSDDIGGATKADDWPEEKVMKTLKHDAGDRFKWTPASVSGPGRLFATSYHIKVAVLSGRGERGSGGALRDKRFWLSSGNWASSNQAPLDDQDHPLEALTWADVRKYDRDWHAIVVNEKLARVFRNHIEQDFADCEALAGEEAVAPVLPDLIVPEDYFLEAPRTVRDYKPFPPKVITGRVKVQPVLTPDNYPDVVLPLIKSAEDSVLFINQSFDIKEDPNQIPEHYRRLLDALLDRQKKIGDVRIIFRSGFGKERDVFRNAVEFGFDKNRIRFFGTCHTKGIVVDKKRVLLGSQNWTGAGTKPNRDASLLIESEEAAKYFADIFEFDWANLATDRVPPDHGPTRRAHAASGEEEAVIPAGFRVVPWGAWSGT